MPLKKRKKNSKKLKKKKHSSTISSFFPCRLQMPQQRILLPLGDTVHPQVLPLRRGRGLHRHLGRSGLQQTYRHRAADTQRNGAGVRDVHPHLPGHGHPHAHRTVAPQLGSCATQV